MTTQDTVVGWTFLDESGTFSLPEPHRTSYLTFPLVNEAGMMSAVTPTLHGDIKTSHNTFLTRPVSVEDLHESRSARNFWVFVGGYGAWSATGHSASQLAKAFVDNDAEQVTLRAGFLWHKIERLAPRVGLRAEIVSYVPQGAHRVELMKVALTNITDRPLRMAATAAIPLYGRSADNLRDHRHVTSLLHRIETRPHGVLVRPTLSFDERGHQPNSVTYAVLGFEGDGAAPLGFFPIKEDFVGEGGNLEWPQEVVSSRRAMVPAGLEFGGFEAMGALRFRDVTLQPGETKAYVTVMAVTQDDLEVDDLVETYGGEARFDDWFEQNEAHWKSILEALSFCTGDRRFDLWMRWVSIQPVLRRLFGNSFLPYHDYGRGGRGWRDLWQDLLSLMIMESESVRPLLLGNFAGVRTDGSNATIIGAGPGEFKADRNNIPRVWMDHGAWPLLTTQLYVERTGDLAFLLEDQVYFKDVWIERAQAMDETWEPEDGTRLRTVAGKVYRGSVLEHMLVQHLTAFFNVGEHNIIRLEGADWNDGLDMAAQRGESVAFSALYASNLRLLSQIVLELSRLGVRDVELLSELSLLLDTFADPVDYQSGAAKQKRLKAYFAVTQRSVSGEKQEVALEDLSRDLSAKADWLYAHLREQEWIEGEEGIGWFNGYYDGEGRRLEGEHQGQARMTLTGQVFALMGGVATDAQARRIARAVDCYLWDPTVGGPRLNTEFGDALHLSTTLGRCFGFAFGHKENGAMFSHMAVMYAYALYQRGLVHEGHRVLQSIYRHSQDFSRSRMYPGIPEYVSPRGRGMYPYLTGSASWYLLTMITRVFGVRGHHGDLLLDPNLVQEQFDGDGLATLSTLFAGRRLDVAYSNPERLDFGDYQVARVRLNDVVVPYEAGSGPTIVPREVLEGLASGTVHRLEVQLTSIEV